MLKLNERRTELLQLLDSGNYVLFAGAGVSVEGGLPTWGGALEQLAERVTAASPLHAQLMRQEVQQRRLLHAAEQFYLAPISLTEREAYLREVFDRPAKVTRRVRSLIRQRFRALVTTNYDRLLIDAAAHERVSLVQYTEQDKDLHAARLSPHRFILRLHGRSEVPSSIVLSQSHYNQLAQNQSYPYFVTHLLSSTPVIFFGFSFADAFFCAVLRALKTASGERMQHKSFALLSGEPERETLRLLESLNIIPLHYEPIDGHAAAWDLLTRQVPPPVGNAGVAEARLRHTLAGILAHLKLSGQSDIREAVLNAAALATLDRHGPADIATLTREIRHDLALPPIQSEQVKATLARLIHTTQATLDADGVLHPTPPQIKSTNASISRLIEGVLARARVRYGLGTADDKDYHEPLRELLLRILISDGLALAYSFVRRGTREIEQVDALVRDSVAAMDTTSRRRTEPLRDAVVSLLTRPERDEEAALDELAALTFVSCLSLSDPSLPALAERMAGRPVFLDASIVLPWISIGHPSGEFYGHIVEALGVPHLAEDYVNEIVSHRQLAFNEYNDAKLGDRRRFELYARYHGLNNINTFVGGYGGWLTANPGCSFEEYLATVAPFTTEDEAMSHLSTRGIGIKRLPFSQANVPLIRDLLKDALAAQGRARNHIRVVHDARMAGHLLDQPKGTRPYFVTADRVLISTIASSPYSELTSHLLLPPQAFSLAQLAGRSRGVVRGLARAIFGMSGDASRQLREFYTERVLSEYEPALVARVGDVVGEIVDHVDQVSVPPTAWDDAASVLGRVRKFAALDQFEPRFHETMERVKRERGL